MHAAGSCLVEKQLPGLLPLMIFESETAGNTLSASFHTDAFVLGSNLPERQTDGWTYFKVFGSSQRLSAAFSYFFSPLSWTPAAGSPGGGGDEGGLLSQLVSW